MPTPSVTPASDARPSYTAVLLAGGDARDPLASAAGVTSKALVEVDGVPLVSRVAGALARAHGIRRIVCVGAGDVAAAARAAIEASRPPPPSLAEPATTSAPPARIAGPAFVSVPGGRDFAASLALGFGAALAPEPSDLLVVTADLPWLEPDAVEGFVAAAAELASASPADLVYPIVPRAASEARFPGQARTWVSVRWGPDAEPMQVTGGNLALVRPAAVSGVLDLAAVAYRARKNPLALARIVGGEALLRLMLGRLRVPRLEARVTRLIGAPVRALVSDDARLSADLDRPDPELAPPRHRARPVSAKT